MTRKNAVAELPYGGAKSVIFDTGPVPDRTELMRRFGEFVARTGGAYLPGVDMGTSVDDLALDGRGRGRGLMLAPRPVARHGRRRPRGHPRRGRARRSGTGPT